MGLTSFGPWQLSLDAEATRLAYSAVPLGSAEDCTCDDCRNWVKVRLKTLPQDILDFFASAGIDPAKELDVTEYEAGSIVDGRKLYIAEYAFIAQLIDGPKVYIPHSDGNGYSVELIPWHDGDYVGVDHWTTFPLPLSFAPEQSLVLTYQTYVYS